jgi:hypothetical protein
VFVVVDAEGNNVWSCMSERKKIGNIILSLSLVENIFSLFFENPVWFNASFGTSQQEKQR